MINILIDTCPALGSLTINASAAADEVIIRVNPQFLAMMGLQDFLKTVKKIKSRINESLAVGFRLFRENLERDPFVFYGDHSECLEFCSEFLPGDSGMMVKFLVIHQ